MKPLSSSLAYDKYVLDVIRLPATGEFVPGAITYRGRKQIQAMSWKEHTFATQDAADAFVREHFAREGIAEPTDQAVLYRVAPPAWLGVR